MPDRRESRLGSSPACPITRVEAIVLRSPVGDPADLDVSSETVVVRIVDEEGRVGIGEADAPAGAVRELVSMQDVHAWSRGLSGILLGRDPFGVPALYDQLAPHTPFDPARQIVPTPRQHPAQCREIRLAFFGLAPTDPGLLFP